MKLTDPAAPLNQRSYQPKHPPSNGRIPAVVSRWSARSQIRWFSRFWRDLKPHTYEELGAFYVDSLSHQGACCHGCASEREDGYVGVDDRCCCTAEDPGFPE